MGGKISKTWAKYGVFAFIKVKNGPNRAKKGLKRAEDRVVVAKNTFFCLDILFAEYLLSEEIILMKPRRKPHNQLCPVIIQPAYAARKGC